jgi:hypothetical protein
MGDFKGNDDSVLLAAVEKIRRGREAAGLKGLVGGLEAVTIASEPDRFKPAVAELLGNTGHDVKDSFSLSGTDVCVLTREGSADILVLQRGGNPNPFAAANKGAKTAAMPGTRLETFIFKCPDVPRYVDIQARRGVTFLPPGVAETPAYFFARTAPSRFTGNSIGVIQWKQREQDWTVPGCEPFDLGLAKPNHPHLDNIGELDHVACRVRAEERDAAILEFMELTGYDFTFSVYVDFLNSITNVARLSQYDYAQVFTSGIAPFTTPEESGPTEMFIYNYGPRSHHMAFNTRNIEATVDALKSSGQGFLSDLVGSREEGLKQIFTKMSPNTMLINEYIHRYDGFDGFFTKSNVTLLTEATKDQ